MKPRIRGFRGLAAFVVAVGLLLLPSLASRARADVYYYKDTDGVFHFTNSPRPDAAPFIVDEPLSQLQTPDDAGDRIPDNDNYETIIGKFAKRFRVEAALIKAVIRAESGFNRMAVSSAGARGLMQLMPDTARRHGVRNIYDAEQNIEGGVRHLRLLLNVHGKSLPRVLAAYNAGSDLVNRYRGIPPIAETRDYVARVLRYRQEYLKKERTAQLAASS